MARLSSLLLLLALLAVGGRADDVASEATGSNFGNNNDNNNNNKGNCGDVDECIDSFEPVCSSIGVTFQNECHFQVAACKSIVAFSLLHVGECTAEDANCPAACPKILMPVCANSGATFSNECLLEQEACTTKTELYAVAKGECPPAAPVAGGKCDMMCIEAYDPVCYDGKDFSSPCDAEKFACTEGQTFSDSAIVKGVCSGAEAPPANNECDIMCAEVFEPVCFNGANFASRCEAEREACVDGIAYIESAVTSGPCEADEPARCDEMCPMIYDPVCALVGTHLLQSYSNECEASRFSCMMKIATMAVLHKGVCKASDKSSLFTYGAPCKTNCDSVYQPVCGNDGRTYDNACELHKVACGTLPHLVVDSTGECVDSDLTGAVDDDESSSGSNECSSVSCPSGSSCVPMELECFTTPCPQYKCVENVVEPDGEPASNHGDSQSSSSSNTASEPGSETTNEASAAGSAVTADGKYFAGVIVGGIVLVVLAIGIIILVVNKRASRGFEPLLNSPDAVFNEMHQEAVEDDFVDIVHA